MKVGFMFAGQGAQAVGMGRTLYDASAAAKAVFDEADRVLGRSLSQLCFDGPMAELTLSGNCQPAIYTMSVACLKALQERVAVSPLACGGLSLGEFAAVHAAGSIDFIDGLKLVARRGELMGEACAATDGAMAAVLNAEPDLVEAICAETDVDVANYNCPGQIVISGDQDKVKSAVAALQERGVKRVVTLEVDGAFHSRLMSSAATAFSLVLDQVALSPPRCTLVQNFIGGAVSNPDAVRANLAAQITGSVRWEQCMNAMLDAGVEALIEFGPGKVLNGFMKRVDRRFPVFNVSDADSLEATVAALA